jgi:hypothetical protein
MPSSIYCSNSKEKYKKNRLKNFIINMQTGYVRVHRERQHTLAAHNPWLALSFNSLLPVAEIILGQLRIVNVFSAGACDPASHIAPKV